MVPKQIADKPTCQHHPDYAFSSPMVPWHTAFICVKNHCVRNVVLKIVSLVHFVSQPVVMLPFIIGLLFLVISATAGLHVLITIT